MAAACGSIALTPSSANRYRAAARFSPESSVIIFSRHLVIWAALNGCPDGVQICKQLNHPDKGDSHAFASILRLRRIIAAQRQLQCAGAPPNDRLQRF
jgi:hypothetical protein